jgi:hypothetical protein
VAGEIHVSGLREFQRGLKGIDKNAPKGLRTAGNEAAGIVVKEAKPRVPQGPNKGGHALSSVRASSTRTAARVSGGSKKFPYYAWLDFGGRVGRNNSVHRPFVKEGRYIWPAFVDKRPQVQDELHKALVEVARAAGVEIR